MCEYPCRSWILLQLDIVSIVVLPERKKHIFIHAKPECKSHCPLHIFIKIIYHSAQRFKAGVTDMDKQRWRHRRVLV